MSELVVSDVRPWGGPPTELLIRDGRIVAGEAGPEATRVDGGGRLAFPAMVDAHAHLDKTTWGCPYRPHSGGGTLASLVDNERAHRGRLGADVTTRAGALLDRYIERGVQGATPTEALMDRPTDRLVIARGRVVAGGEGVR